MQTRKDFINKKSKATLKDPYKTGAMLQYFTSTYVSLIQSSVNLCITIHKANQNVHSLQNNDECKFFPAITQCEHHKTIMLINISITK